MMANQPANDLPQPDNRAISPNSKPAALMLLRITLYNDENEEVGHFERSFVPWGILKKAKNLMKYINQEHPEDMPDEVFDALAEMVVETFGNHFTVDDLTRYADVEDMVSILLTIINKASALLPANPTRPG